MNSYEGPQRADHKKDVSPSVVFRAPIAPVEYHFIATCFVTISYFMQESQKAIYLKKACIIVIRGIKIEE